MVCNLYFWKAVFKRITMTLSFHAISRSQNVICESLQAAPSGAGGTAAGLSLLHGQLALVSHTLRDSFRHQDHLCNTS